MTLDHVTADLLYSNVVFLRDSSTLTVKSSHLAEKALAAAHGAVVSSQMFGTGSISIADTEITGGTNAISNDLPLSLTITGSNLHDNTGLALDMSNYVSPTVVISNTMFTNNGTASTQIQGPMRISATILNLKMRGNTFKNNGGTSTNYYGVNIAGGAGSSYDLGTVADPGLNTFLTNGVSGVALHVNTPVGITVQAVGNTWAPSVQGADTNGKYAAPAGAGMKLDITGPVTATAKNNYALDSSMILRLAENP